MIQRRQTKKVYYGDVAIGGDSPVTVQSMTTTKTSDVKATVTQIHELEEVGCDIIRVAVPDQQSAEALPSILKQIAIPLVADIHFDYRLALAAIDAGVQALRLNPGNLRNPESVQLVLKSAQAKKIPIRVGANAGSIDHAWLDGLDDSLSREERIAHGMAKGALQHIKILENHNFTDIVVSLKASDVITTVIAYKLMAQQCDYPFHLGITEAGPLTQGTVKSSIGLGILLNEGIGDTIRVSLTDNPIHEVHVGRLILQSLGLRREFPEIVSCPTCGRCRIQVIDIAKKVEKALSTLKGNIKVAVMGCEVNGPGEARDADIGIAGGNGYGILFKHGSVVGRVPEDKLIDVLLEEVKNILAEKGDI
jgi:(E)-4-hydroxy-3-methylbut-2-enyl-diphosphate synthase